MVAEKSRASILLTQRYHCRADNKCFAFAVNFITLWLQVKLGIAGLKAENRNRASRAWSLLITVELVLQSCFDGEGKVLTVPPRSKQEGFEECFLLDFRD